MMNFFLWKEKVGGRKSKEMTGRIIRGLVLILSCMMMASAFSPFGMVSMACSQRTYVSICFQEQRLLLRLLLEVHRVGASFANLYSGAAQWLLPQIWNHRH